MASNDSENNGTGSSDEAPAAKKTSAKRTAAKKAPAKKTAPRKTTKRAPSRSDTDRSSSGAPAPKAAQIAAEASAQLLALAGKGAEGVVGIDRTDDGWVVKVEVLELRRIPSTTDVLATYEIKTDESGDLLGYRRLGRYVRGTPGED